MKLPFLLRSARRFRTVVGLLVGLAINASVLSAADPTYLGPLSAGTVEGPPRKETSGLAVSRRSPGVFWVHDDSKGTPVLYATDASGQRRGAVQVRGVKNEDWEDVASFEKDGKAWLLVADVGDNDAKRKTVRIHLIEEPAPDRLNPAAALEVAPAYTLRLRYEDGPRDCESVAVDPIENAIYLLTKRDSPPRLYRLPLNEANGSVVEAKLIEPVPDIIGQTQIDAVIKHIVGKKFSWPTAMDFSADRRAALVLTYGEPLVFTRQAGETWAAAFQRAPTRLLFHGLPQAEGACFSADGRSIFVASEENPALIRYDLETEERR